jgi:hypothetical protein
VEKAAKVGVVVGDGGGGGGLSRRKAEPEFLNILQCNSAESVSAGFPFNFLDKFNDKINMYRHFDKFSILLKFTQKNHFYQHTKTVWYEPCCTL